MFIVNQDRDTTINLNNVKEIFVSQERIFADNTVIGKYKTEERTTQVYNEMLQILFSPYMMLKNAELPPDAMKNFANGNVILLKSADREPDVKFYDNDYIICRRNRDERFDFCTYMVCGTGNLYLCELERCKVQQRCKKGNHADE